MIPVDSTSASRVRAESDRPSLVAQTLVGSAVGEAFETSVDAMIDALAAANRGQRIARWSIVVGVATGGESDDAALEGLARRAAESGGTLTAASIDEKDGHRAAHGRLASAGDEELILIVDAGAGILASTIVRLIDALDRSGAGAVRARAVPRPVVLPGETERFGCSLFARAALGGAAVGAQAAPLVPPPVATPEAVVFERVGIVASAVDGAHESDGASSLIEHALDAEAFTRARVAVATALATQAGPLLSIVMRTQLQRPEALRDVLACLAGQSDARFELLLVAHDVPVPGIGEILADQPERLQSRTRILQAEGGTRSRPINVGIAAAEGSLVAFLDDDDLVSTDWVGAFLRAAERFPRRLLRAGTAVQRVRAAPWANGVTGHAAASEQETPYPPVYDLSDHLRVHMTPFMAFAFPRGFFETFGGADESLAVCEDWDLSLRAARVLGVGDIPAVTSVYRRWTTGGDSYSTHDGAVWERDMLRVRAKLDAAPLLLPPGSASTLARYSALADSEGRLDAVYASTSWRVTAPVRALADRLGGVRSSLSSRFRSSDR